jgi:hypothetical protein
LPATTNKISEILNNRQGLFVAWRQEPIMTSANKNITFEILQKLTDCLQESEEQLMGRVLEYAIQQGFAKYTSTLKEACRHIMDRLFDRVEIGFCTEWAASGSQHLDELQSSNRAMTNEKNKYLTIFESLPFPVILLDAQNRIDNLNHAASMWLGGYTVPGAYYYCAKCELKSNDTSPPPPAEAAQGLPEWLLPEIERFSARPDLQYNYLQKEVQVEDDLLLYFIQLSKMMDISGKFAGSVIMVQDFTADLIHLIESYGRLAAAIEAPDPTEQELKSELARVRKVESFTDMGFLCEDIQEIIDECKEGADRVRQIVVDLKDFEGFHPSRLHQASACRYQPLPGIHFEHAEERTQI